MPTRLTVRLDQSLLDSIDSYAASHGLDRATVVRLALTEQLRRSPRKTLPPGVERFPGNPDPLEAAKLGAATRWGKSAKS